jgi:hypothetical protein
MFSFTACVWIGIVMISMISSTNITSINGVVLMSTITSPSLEAAERSLPCSWLLIGSAAVR